MVRGQVGGRLNGEQLVPSVGDKREQCRYFSEKIQAKDLEVQGTFWGQTVGSYKGPVV